MGEGGTSFVSNLCAFVTFHFRNVLLTLNESIGGALALKLGTTFMVIYNE